MLCFGMYHLRGSQIPPALSWKSVSYNSQKFRQTLCGLCFVLLPLKKTVNGEGSVSAVTGTVWHSLLVFFIYLLAQKGNQSIWVKRFRDFSWVAISAWLITLHKISLPRKCASIKLSGTWAWGAVGGEIILMAELITVQLRTFGDGEGKNHQYWSSQVLIALARCHVAFSSALLQQSWVGTEAGAGTGLKVGAGEQPAAHPASGSDCPVSMQRDMQ